MDFVGFRGVDVCSLLFCVVFVVGWMFGVEIRWSIAGIVGSDYGDVGILESRDGSGV